MRDRAAPTVVIYTDAAAEGREVIRGLVLFCPGHVPLTTTVGFQHIAVRESDGAVLMVSGFNEHVKATCKFDETVLMFYSEEADE